MAEEHISSGPCGSVEEENARLKLLIEKSPPDEILVVSDLHLGRGREPYTTRFVRTENFVSDQAFKRFIQAHQPAPNKLLVLNGDTFDFIRICNFPSSHDEFDQWKNLLAALGVVKSCEQLRAAISRKEKRYGLQTDDYKSAWKLSQIAAGHREFFQALTYWVEHGGTLLMMKGNHDLDLYWPLVRKALCFFLAREIANEKTRQEAIERVFYCDNSVCIRNVYLEHGHLYDPQQQVKDKCPTMAEDPSQLNLPLATFVARYLINQLEKLEPFLGSVRPIERVPWLMLSKHPLASIAILGRSLRFLRRAAKISKLHNTFWFMVYFLSVALPLVTGLLIALVVVCPSCYQSAVNFLLKLPVISWIVNVIVTHPLTSTILGFVAPFIAAALREFFRWLNITGNIRKFMRRLRKQPDPLGEDELAQGVYETLQNKHFPEANIIYAVMGHTHDQDIQNLSNPTGPKVLYLNTGAWIPVWPQDRPDLAGKTLYPFVRLKKHSPQGEYAHGYFEWRDDRNQPAEAYILAPASTK